MQFGKNFEGNNHGLIEVLFWDLAGGPGENCKNLSTVADVLAEI
jgi:hypothetical protein